MTGSAGDQGGAARALPAGRLRSIEEADNDPQELGRLLSRRPAGALGHARPSTAEETAPTAASSRSQPTGAERGNRMRSSSVHVPSDLIALVVAARDRSGRSNGELVIAALEHSHPQLGALIATPSAGGGLFAARGPRQRRAGGAPLTALNVRLYEADFAVLDQLVTQFGAHSRGHLISVALAHYLTGPEAP